MDEIKKPDDIAEENPQTTEFVDAAGEQPITDERPMKTTEQFVEYMIGQYAVGMNPIIKDIRNCIATCFDDDSTFADKEFQKEILTSLLLKILDDKELSDVEKKALELHHVEKHLFRPDEDFYLKDCLVDFLYSCYEFRPDQLKKEVGYIDKIANFIN